MSPQLHLFAPHGIFTVLQIQVYPKKNAPEVSKPPRVAKRDFLLILKIFSNLDDIQHSNKFLRFFYIVGLQLPKNKNAPTNLKFLP